MNTHTDNEEHDAPWLVVPFVLMLVLGLGLLLIARWSLRIGGLRGDMLCACPPSRPMPRLPPTAADARRYGAVAMALHWLLALLIVASFSVGLYMAGLPFSPMRLKLFNWHKWAGITILALSALRLLWRLSHRRRRCRPHRARHAAAGSAPRTAARTSLLYLLFFAVPLLGWAYSSALGFPVVWFGVLPLPDFVPVDKDLAEAVLKPLHQALRLQRWPRWCCCTSAAALKHQFVDRDGLLRRMWPVAQPEHPMMNRPRHRLARLCAAACFAAAAPAPAEPTAKLVPAQSQIAFVSKQMGVPVEGEFKKFDAQIAFDPKKPEGGRVALQIDIGSATLGVAESDAELPKPAWFDTAQFPQATLPVAAPSRAWAAGRFEVAGKLDDQGHDAGRGRAGGDRAGRRHSRSPPAASRSSGSTSRSATANGPTPRWSPTTCRCASSSSLTGLGAALIGPRSSSIAIRKLVMTKPSPSHALTAAAALAAAQQAPEMAALPPAARSRAPATWSTRRTPS